MKRTLIIILMLLAMAFPVLSQAAGEGGERILDYAVTARVEEDASLVVTERITVTIDTSVKCGRIGNLCQLSRQGINLLLNRITIDLIIDIVCRLHSQFPHTS